MIINPKYKNVFFDSEVPIEEPIPIEEEETTTNPKSKKKNLITVLKKLLKAFGGDDAKVKNNAVDIVDKIADKVNSGGSGGVEPVVVTLTPTSEMEGTWSGATWEELVNAYYHGCAFVVIGEDAAVNPINGPLTIENGIAIEMEFSNIVMSDVITMITITISNDNTVFIGRSQYPASIETEIP